MLLTCKPALQLSDCRAIFAARVMLPPLVFASFFIRIHIFLAISEGSQGWIEEAHDTDGEAEAGVRGSGHSRSAEGHAGQG